MKKLVRGIHQFREKIFKNEREFFEKLAEGQSPEALFITCSDSRLNPNLLTQTGPGEIFILRNAGNIIPAFNGDGSGEAATIEFGIEALGIKEIIICGHSHCGAVKGLLNPKSLEKLPAVSRWLKNAQNTYRVVMDNYEGMSDEDLLNVAIQENVLCQIENLRTHPSVASRVARGEINLHAWIHKFETGEVFAFDAEEQQFSLLGSHSKPLPTLRSVISSTIENRKVV